MSRQGRAHRRGVLLPGLISLSLLALAWATRESWLAVWRAPMLPVEYVVRGPEGIAAAPGPVLSSGARRTADHAATSGVAPRVARPAADPADLSSHPTAAPAEDTTTGFTRTGLRTYSAPPAPPLAPATATPAIAPEEDRLLRAFEARPSDAQRLQPLVDWLSDHERDDEALEQLVRFAEAGGEPELTRRLSARLDPFRERKQELLQDALEHTLELAQASLVRRLWLNTRSFLDQARLLLAALREELGQPADELSARVATLSEQLLAPDAARRALAAAGVTLPAHVLVGSRLTAAADLRADARAVQEQRAQQLTSRHFRTTTLLPRATAVRANEVLEATYAAAVTRFGLDPLRKGDPLAVEIVADASTFETRRRNSEPSPAAWVGAYLDRKERRILVLDPAQRGADAARLWSLLARETWRFVSDGLRPAPRRLPEWLSWGLSLQAEGVSARTGTPVRLGSAPADRWRELAASLTGSGLSPRGLEDVLQFDGRDPNSVVFAFGLVAWLQAGAPGLAGLDAEQPPLDRLLRAYADDTQLPPSTALRSVALRQQDGSAPSTRSVQSAWRAWLDERAARLASRPEALSRWVDELQQQIGQRAFDQARESLAELLTVAPGRTDALALAVSLARRRNDDDRALLAARALGSARATALNPAPATQRLAQASELITSVGTLLVARDQALRDGAASLVTDLLADDRPLAAVRLADRLGAAWPVDGQWRGLREHIATTLLSGDELLVVRRLSVPDSLDALHGDRELWQSLPGGVAVLASDRSEATSLPGVVWLGAPWHLSLRVEFSQVNGKLPSGPGHLVGLLCGAATPAEQGQWGVLLTPSGQVQLASRGHLEWPGRSIGRGRRESNRLEVWVEGRGLGVAVDGRELGTPSLGSRAPDGWLTLYARGVDASLTELTLSRSRQVNPRQAGWLLGNW